MRLPVVAFLVALCLTSCSEFAKVQKSDDYEYKLRMAEKYYVQHNYHYAIQLYEELFPLVKGTDRFEDLFYKYAYCAYYLQDWMNAENLFKQFTEVFPTSARAEEMAYMRAYCFYRQSPKPELDQTNTQKAIGLMQTFINTHPGSAKSKEAAEIIDICRKKLETKELKNAQLYFDMGHYRAAAITFTSLMNDFPDSQKSDEYKLQVIKSYYLFAENSIESKKPERYEQVVSECNEFADRFPESSLTTQVKNYLTLAQNNIKAYQNEPVKTTT